MFYQETVKIFIAFTKSVTVLKIQTPARGPAASQLVFEVRLITNYLTQRHRWCHAYHLALIKDLDTKDVLNTEYVREK